MIYSEVLGLLSFEVSVENVAGTCELNVDSLLREFPEEVFEPCFAFFVAVGEEGDAVV